jgi:hypothetical protein
MAWMARVAGLSALLALPAWLLMPFHQRLLASLAALVLATFGMKVQFEDVMVAAPFDLALFAAMCLASLRVPTRRRMRSLLIGTPVLVVGEVLVVVAVVLLTVAARSSGQATSARVADHLGESIPWVNAALAWLVLFGKDELPQPGEVRARRTGSIIAR